MRKTSYRLEWTVPDSDIEYTLSDYLGENSDDLVWMRDALSEAGADVTLIETKEQVVQ